MRETLGTGPVMRMHDATQNFLVLYFNKLQRHFITIYVYVSESRIGRKAQRAFSRTLVT